MRRAIIVGKGPGCGLAPFEKIKGSRIWGINNVYADRYVDAIWDMHDIEWTEEEIRQHYDHLKDIIDEEEIERRIKLKQRAFGDLRKYCLRTNKPYMSVRKYPDIPSSVSYPLQKIINRFDCDYFTSTVTYAIAYAIYKDYDSVELFGVGCVYQEEWAYQRASVSHWMGIAKGRGMFTAITGEAGRPLRTHNGKLYGYGIPQRERGIKCIDGYIDHINEIIYKAEVWKES